MHQSAAADSVGLVVLQPMSDMMGDDFDSYRAVDDEFEPAQRAEAEKLSGVEMAADSGTEEQTVRNGSAEGSRTTARGPS